MSKKPSWANEEENRAKTLAYKDETNNEDAPRIKQVMLAPKRIQKAFYIQPKYAKAFDNLVLLQKEKKGKKAPVLAEEAIKILLKKYKQDTSNL